MDIKQLFLEYQNITFDRLNRRKIVPKYFDYFYKDLNRKVKTHYKYKNLEDFHKISLDYLFNVIAVHSKLEKIAYLDLEEDINLRFNITHGTDILGFRYLRFSIEGTDKASENKDIDICVSFTWFPFSKLIVLDSLFYHYGEKIEPNVDCRMKNIPKKAGPFIINLVEDISKKFNVKINCLQDASRYFLDSGLKISLSFYNLNKNGRTYYQKFGFKPTKDDDRSMIFKLLLGIPFTSAKEELDYVVKK